MLMTKIMSACSGEIFVGFIRVQITIILLNWSLGQTHQELEAYPAWSGVPRDRSFVG